MRTLIVCSILFFLVSTVLFGQIPQTISYQGVLTDSDGTAVTDGSYTMHFGLYTSETGTTVIWSESQIVLVVNGIFNVLLGKETPLDLPFDRTYWMGVSIGNGSELLPRVQFSSSAYSLRARSIDDGAVHTASIADSAVTGIKIGAHQVVKSVNGMKDEVTLVAGTNITLTPDGNNITIDAAGGSGGSVTQVNTGAGLTGGPITTTGTISIPADGVTSTMILDNTITTADLADNSVTSEKIVDASITSTDIAPAQVVKSINALQDSITLVAGSNITITPSGQNLTISSSMGVGGSGGINYIPRFTSSTTLGSSAIFQWPGNNFIGIGTTNPIFPLHVASTNDNGVIYGEFTGPAGVDGRGVRGRSRPSDGHGIGGFFEGGYYGVYGFVTPSGSQHYIGVYGTVYGGDAPAGHRYGVYGSARGEGTGYRYGVYGFASGGTQNWAGYFEGDVNVLGTLVKGAGSFKIDHPLDPTNKNLYHSFVESPDMMNIYNGNVVTDGSGYASVTLPDWFEALNKDFRYQLTVIGDFAHAVIAQEVQGNQFSIRTDKPNVKVSWQVTGIRKDPFAEKYRIPVEEMKQGNEIGKYNHPEAYGMPDSMGVNDESTKLDKEKR